MAKKAASQGKGQGRIQELMEMFPEFPRQVVIKADYIREGVRHTPILDQVGKWAIPDPHELFEYDYDVDSHAQEDVEGGHVLTPYSMHLRNGVALQLMYRSTSPYEVKYEGRGCYWLYRDDEPLEEVHFPPSPQWYRKTTSSGKPMSSVFGLCGDRFLRLIVSNYCEHFVGGYQCQFCNLNPTAEHLSELGQERMLVKREQEVYEAYMACAQETGVEFVVLTGGAFRNRKKEADLYIRTYQVLKRAMQDSGCRSETQMTCQAMEEEDLWRLKEAGATDVYHCQEVWDPQLFEIICPGKARVVGREKWLEALLRGVEIFGRWRVGSNFVLGVELAQPFGFKTEDEAFASNMEAFRWLGSHGISFGYNPWQNRPGSKLEHVEPPRVEYILRTEAGRLRLCKEFNMSPARVGEHLPSVLFGHTVDTDWINAPQGTVWPPALRG